MTPALPTLIAAVDRLNGYVRNREAYMHFGLQEHVYTLKGYALAAVEEAGATQRRRIFVQVICGSCSGTGLFGRRRELCWTCRATGKKRLYFVETRIGKTLHCLDWPLADIVWHTPKAGPRDGEPDHAEEETDWKPRTPGRGQATDEMVMALNEAEAAVTEISMLCWGRVALPHARHTLYLGKAEGRCAFCSDLWGLETIRGSRGLLWWLAQICKPCKKHYRMLSVRHGYWGRDLAADRLPIPASLITPAIETWMNNRGGRAAVLKTAPAEFYA